MLWPADGTFGESGILPEAEFLELGELFYADLKTIDGMYAEAMHKFYGTNHDEMNNRSISDISDVDNEMIGEEEMMGPEEHHSVTKIEVDFDINDYILRFSRQDILIW